MSFGSTFYDMWKGVWPTGRSGGAMESRSIDFGFILHITVFINLGRTHSHDPCVGLTMPTGGDTIKLHLQKHTLAYYFGIARGYPS